MKKESNILLTSLSNQYDRLSHRYFYFTRDGETKFCDGLSVAEAGAKYLLSNVPIDEIIVLGNGRTYDKGQEMVPLVLKEWSDFNSEDTSALSEYSFFQYRIAQFLDGLDLEAVDVLEDASDIRQDYIMEKYQKFLDEIKTHEDFRPDRIFYLLTMHEELVLNLMDHISDATMRELLWLKRKIYTALADSMKFSPRQDNSDLKICFIPTEKNKSRNYVPAENVTQLVKALDTVDAEQVNIYMDMQGLASTEGYTFLAVLTMLSLDVNSRIKIREIITSNYDPVHFAGKIDNNEMKRYDINVLVSGMSAFVRYGKVDDVLAYWNSRGIQNEHIDHLLYAMHRVDDGISLCNIEDLVAGITMLRKVFETTPTEDLPEVESNIFRILEETIRLDYGPLLEGDSINQLELIKWSFRKEFYQQTLTIIESKIPIEIVNSGMFFYACDEASRDAFMQEINKQYWECAPKDRWQFDHISHFFVKNYAKTAMKRNPASKDRARDYTNYRLDSLEEGKSELLKTFSRLDDRKVLGDVLYAYYSLGTIRNHVNHAQESVAVNIDDIDIHAENPNMKMIKAGINTLIDAFEKALKYMEEHPVDILMLTVSEAEFKEYSAAHKVYKNDKFERKDQRDSSPKRDNDKNDETKPAESAQGEAAKPAAPAPSGDSGAPKTVQKEPEKKAEGGFGGFVKNVASAITEAGKPNIPASVPTAPNPPSPGIPKPNTYNHPRYDNRKPDEKRYFKPNNSGNYYHGKNNNHSGPRQQVINISTGNGNSNGKLLRITINIEEERSGEKKL